MEHLVAKSAISKKIRTIIQPTIEGLGFEIVRIKFSEEGKPTLKIMVDKNDNGVEIAECALVSTSVSAILDVSDPIDQEYNLEISSPGINRPLTRRKDFDIWKGYNIKIKTAKEIDRRKNFKGMLKGTKNEEILLEISEGTIGLCFDWIEEAKLLISVDKLINNQHQQSQSAWKN